ncbi:MAG: hypothetical protein ACR2FV_03295 [Ornithinimicrobium sp.]|uniref:hypothetical protein n=1 Tax=Ornithinimicrobium sp. TaxID=1977084 RepID=UPI003D9BD04A
MSTIARTTTRTRIAALASAATDVAALVTGVGGPTAQAVNPEPATAQTTMSSSDWCNRQLGTPGSIPSLGFGKRSWPLTGGLHMNTYNGTVARNTGTVSATTHLYNSYWGMGYTGAVTVVLKNSCNEPIGVTTPAQYGVDAKAWFWNQNERWEYHSDNLGADITSRTASVEVIHNRVTGANAIENYRRLRSIACAVYEPGCKFIEAL